MGSPDCRRRRYRQWLIATGAAAVIALSLTLFVLRRPDVPVPAKAHKPTPGDGVAATCPKSDLLKNMTTREYDIREMLSLLTKIDGAKKSRAEIVGEIMAVITESIDPVCGPGCHGGKGSIEEIGGLLIVTQAEEHHESLARLLDQLHASLSGGGPLTHPMVRVSNEGDSKRQEVLRVYDIRDLIALVCKPEGADMRTMISDTVDRDSWRDAGGELGSMPGIGGLLVVQGTEKNHASLATLLEK